MKRQINLRSFTRRHKNGFPIIFHAHDCPAIGLSKVEALVEFADVRCTIIGPFALCVIVMNAEANIGTSISAAPNKLSVLK
jgi:hypothetical protein